MKKEKKKGSITEKVLFFFNSLPSSFFRQTSNQNKNKKDFRLSTESKEKVFKTEGSFM